LWRRSAGSDASIGSSTSPLRQLPCTEIIRHDVGASFGAPGSVSRAPATTNRRCSSSTLGSHSPKWPISRGLPLRQGILRRHSVRRRVVGRRNTRPDAGRQIADEEQGCGVLSPRTDRRTDRRARRPAPPELRRTAVRRRGSLQAVRGVLRVSCSLRSLSHRRPSVGYRRIHVGRPASLTSIDDARGSLITARPLVSYRLTLDAFCEKIRCD
jgi:hypothetical protein